MNIKEAKEQIVTAVKAYLAKDEYGGYRIPVSRQRPIVLMGAPGIGKTEIMAQVASELGIGLVAYSMTHHTRQSSLGLPVIVKKTYGGRDYEVSEYTMSEIIASMYDLIEETGVKEGILFLDEINCVSETLTPVMLQFLQYKTFGRHRVPNGWAVVTAGNPPEYNQSAREFDIVTWDRLKRIDVEPDFAAWVEYAVSRNVHAAVLSYLKVKPQNFYHIETTVDGKRFVTARGWVDLSEMISVCEGEGLPVDKGLISQYLQNGEVAADFAVYYDLFIKYKEDFRVEAVLDGTATEAVRERIKEARFDERIAFMSIAASALSVHLRVVVERREALEKAREALLSLQGVPEESACRKKAQALRNEAERGEQAGKLSEDRQRALRCAAEILDRGGAWENLRGEYNRLVMQMEQDARTGQALLRNLFAFCDEVFGDGQEMAVLMSDLTLGRASSAFIGSFGCPEYFAHSKELMFDERQQELQAKIRRLGI